MQTKKSRAHAGCDVANNRRGTRAPGKLLTYGKTPHRHTGISKAVRSDSQSCSRRRLGGLRRRRQDGEDPLLLLWAAMWNSTACARQQDRRMGAVGGFPIQSWEAVPQRRET